MRFVHTLDTHGGHILACLVLLLFGCGMALLGVPKAEDVIVAAITLFGRAMYGSSERTEARESSTKTTATETTKIAAEPEVRQ